MSNILSDLDELSAVVKENTIALKNAYKFRIYPTEQQEATLLKWNRGCKFLFNRALEQRLYGLNRTKADKEKFKENKARIEESIIGKDKTIHSKEHLAKLYKQANIELKDYNIYPSYFEQSVQMTECLQQEPWLAEIPGTVRQEILRNLDKAWQRFNKGLAKKPRFKKSSFWCSFYTPAISGWRLTQQDSRFNVLRFCGLGDIKIRQDRQIEGTPSSCTITKDADWWYAIILCSQTIDKPAESTKPSVGIDRGVCFPIADSNGRLVANPNILNKFEKKLARLQRLVSKKEKRSKNWYKAQMKVARVHRDIRYCREDMLHKQSSFYAENNGIVKLEKLAISNMVKSASGTIDNPGTNVKQKSKLNKSIYDVAWYKFSSYLKYKLERTGGRVEEVNPKYSSQECSKCGYISSENRLTREVFRCTKCGHEAHADTNAACVINNREILSKIIKEKKTIKIKGRTKRIS
jgi:putative transposase